MKLAKQVFSQIVWHWALVTIAIAAFFMSILHIYAIFKPNELEISSDGSDGVFKYLIICMAVLAILRAGSLLKAKFFGVEFEFSAMIEQSNQLKLEVQELRNSIEEPLALPESEDFSKGADLPRSALVPVIRMPELGTISIRGDQQKGRFGGAAQGGGYDLFANFVCNNIDDPVVRVVLIVARTDGNALEERVTFFLHETFKPRDEIVVSPTGRDANIELLVYGGFTVGAWVHGTIVLLELDLAEIKKAPNVIRER